MRELEFLPDWYPRVRAWRQRLMLQASITAVAAAIALLWVQLAQGNIVEAQETYAAVGRSLKQARGELRLLDEQKELLERLRQQEQVESRLGLSVDMTRVLGTLQASLPESMSLLDLTIETVTTRRLARNGSSGKDVERESRVLHIGVTAVAPSDAEINTFFGRLIEGGVFENPQMKYARDRSAEGRDMREVAVSLELALDTPE